MTHDMTTFYRVKRRNDDRTWSQGDDYPTLEQASAWYRWLVNHGFEAVLLQVTEAVIEDSKAKEQYEEYS